MHKYEYANKQVYGCNVNVYLGETSICETTTSICESIGQNLLKKINQNNFCSNKFNKILMNFDEYLEQLSQVITNIHKLI